MDNSIQVLGDFCDAIGIPTTLSKLWALQFGGLGGDGHRGAQTGADIIGQLCMRWTQSSATSENPIYQTSSICLRKKIRDEILAKHSDSFPLEKI